MDGFQHDDPHITAFVKGLSEKMPTMFGSMLPADAVGVGEIEEDADEVVVKIVGGDSAHFRPTVLYRMKPAHCKRELNLPIREKEMSRAFRISLQGAYRDHYGMNITVISNHPLKWWKKISFSEGTKPTGSRPLVFQRGHYVAYRGSNGGEEKARLDEILLHEGVNGSGEWRVFLLVTPIRDLPGRYDILTKLPVVGATPAKPLAACDEVAETTQTFIGLSALLHEKLYMVPFDDSNGEYTMITDPSAAIEQLLYVDWRIQFF
ncbi:hypothetical protein GGR56DRAFT_239652 [Xylariaceae sp. FL0804]|nr:hypothetical protein GGR56DRAFT_239652 [Xylariaceae sp. FL0804]